MSIEIRVGTIDGAKEVIRASIELCQVLNTGRSLEEEVQFVIEDLMIVDKEWKEELTQYGKSIIEKP